MDESPEKLSRSYVGRLAPSPTGYLHLGHASTFSIAAKRARNAGGKLLLRIDDLDRERCRPEFTAAAIEDLRAIGLHWDGPPILQSQRLAHYRRALESLHAAGRIYPCTKTRKEIREAAAAQHARSGRNPSGSPPNTSPDSEEQDAEPLYPLHFRPPADAPLPPLGDIITVNWRFRTPEGEMRRFVDGALGEQTAQVGRDIGDFLVWRKDDLPSYQLACVVDDIEMGITEVVRGADLLRSTFRQLLLYRALGAKPPEYYHCDLIRDETGARLAKRHAASDRFQIKNSLRLGRATSNKAASGRPTSLST